MPSQLNIFQQVFELSLASNEVGECKGTSSDLQQRLKDQINMDLQKFVPDWTVAWGPVAWKENANDTTQPPGNAWYIAKNDSAVFKDGEAPCSVYVVAIAGTAGIYDWIVEDFSVRSAIDLDVWLAQPNGISGVPPSNNHTEIPDDHPAVSDGFGNAIFQLMNNAPPSGSPGAELSLPDFLKSLPHSSTSKLIFTGHSLGGALSPALAFTLLKAGFLGSFAKENVYVYPTAGPTPGNKKFASEFKASFPPPESSGALTGYQHWNCNIIHPLDVVPQAFCQDPSASSELLSNIVDLYGTLPFFDQNWALEIGITGLEILAGDFYYPLTSSSFTSVFPKPDTPPDTTENFLDEAHKQHVDPYGFEIIGKAVPPSLCSIKKQEEWMTHPVLGFFAGKAAMSDRSL